jgi:hypothetical protein
MNIYIYKYIYIYKATDFFVRAGGLTHGVWGCRGVAGSGLQERGCGWWAAYSLIN